jgi:hypothetical protein
VNVSWPRQITHASLHPPLTPPTPLSTGPFSSGFILTSHPPSDSVHVTAILHPSRLFPTIDSRDIIRSRPLAELPTICAPPPRWSRSASPFIPQEPPISFQEVVPIRVDRLPRANVARYPFHSSPGAGNQPPFHRPPGARATTEAHFLAPLIAHPVAAMPSTPSDPSRLSR